MPFDGTSSPKMLDGVPPPHPDFGDDVAASVGAASVKNVTTGTDGAMTITVNIVLS